MEQVYYIINNGKLPFFFNLNIKLIKILVNSLFYAIFAKEKQLLFFIKIAFNLVKVKLLKKKVITLRKKA